MKLSDVKIRSLSSPGKHADGGGLYLEITSKGSKYWRLKYRYGGVEKRLAFGVYPDVGLKQARGRRDEARQQLAKGLDPGAERKAAKSRAHEDALNTVKAISLEWLEHQSGRWAPITLARITASFEADLFPILGKHLMRSTTARDVLNVVQRIEKRGAGEIASRMFQRVKSIFRFAIVHRRIEANPISEMRASDVLRPRKVQHRPAITESNLPEFLQRLAAYQGDPNTVSAIRLLMLTGVRSGELRGALWKEIDWESAKWRIPADRMKMKIEHVVPLSSQAMAELKKMQQLSGTHDLIYPSPFYPGKPLSKSTLNGAFVRMGYKGEATPHGMRSLFSSISNEAGWNSDAIERQLAHVENNKVRAAYNRSTYLEQRTDLMQWWADYLDSRSTGKAVEAPSRQSHPAHFETRTTQPRSTPLKSTQGRPGPSVSFSR